MNQLSITVICVHAHQQHNVFVNKKCQQQTIKEFYVSYIYCLKSSINSAGELEFYIVETGDRLSLLYVELRYHHLWYLQVNIIIN